MKRILIALAICLTLGACSSDIQENRETRSTVYVGQTTWDLYENFGTPTKAERISENEVHFHYHREAITRNWTDMYYDWCDMTFVTVDDRVVDWWSSGNQCFLNSRASSDEGSNDTGAEPASTDNTAVYQEEDDTYYPASDEDAYPTLM